MKYKYSFLVLLFSGFFLAQSAKAVCPVCVVAIGAGLGLSRWLGVDDIISGIWIGALLVSLAIWTHDWIVKKGWGFKFGIYVVSIAYYLLTFIPLYFTEITGHPLNRIFGIDKLVFGTAFGTIIFIASVWLHNFLKIKNNGKSFFQYQKVVVPVIILILSSILFYLLLIWKII